MSHWMTRWHRIAAVVVAAIAAVVVGVGPAQADVSSAQGTKIAPTEGAAFTGTVATFSSKDTASCLTASIDWGDQTGATVGSISGSGSYTVAGSHTYAEEGSPSVTVSISDACDKTNAIPTTQATVADAQLSATAGSLSGTAGARFSGEVASFTDSDPSGTASDYAATIDWGDGSSSSGTVSANGSGGFSVSGSHTYSGGGSYSVATSVTDAGGATSSARANANIAAAASPTAALTVVTSALRAGRRVTFSAAGSSPGSGQIISYDWDFTGTGHFTTSTGTHPTAQFTFPAGTHTVEVRVANSSHLMATASVTITMPTAHGAGAPAGCSAGVNIGLAQILTDGCVMAAGDGTGYTITASDIDFNGMDLVTRDGRQATFTLSTSTAGSFLSGPAVDVMLLNTPAGDELLGTLDLTAQPLDLSQAIHAAGDPAAHPADASSLGFRLATFGVGHMCASGDSSPACCPPPSGNTACATLPGGFPLSGVVNIYLDERFQVIVDVNVGLDLPSVGFSATGQVDIVADLSTGIHLSSLTFGVPDANLRFLHIHNAQFQYFFPDYVDPMTGDSSNADSWEAMATVIFGPPSTGLQIMGDVSFKQGNFDHASMVLTLPRGVGIPIYPGVLLNRFGGLVASNPFALGGTLGASIAASVELTLSFQYAEPTAHSLGYFAGRGQLEYMGDQIATLVGEVFSDGFFDAGLTIDIHFPLDAGDDSSASVVLSGALTFWDESSSGRYEGTGDVHLKLFSFIDAEAAGLFNNVELAGCIGVDGFGVQGWYRPSDGHSGGGAYAFSNCTDQLRQYHTHPLVPHCGPFTNTPSGCIAAANDAVILPSGTRGQELRITSPGTPVVKVTSPDGKLSFTSPSAPGVRVARAGAYIATLDVDPHQLLIFLAHPKGGRWRLDPVAGAPPIGSVQVAGDVAPPSVHLSVHHRRGARWVLAYRITNFVAGSSIQFTERSKDATHVIGVARSASGQISFTPQDAITRSRRIEADILRPDGSGQMIKVAGSYKAPPAIRAGRPGRLRISRHADTATVTWGAAARARVYDVTVRGSDGRVSQFRLPRGTRRIVVNHLLPFVSLTVTISAEGGVNLLTGPSATGRLKGARFRPPRPPKHPRKLARLPGSLNS